MVAGRSPSRGARCERKSRLVKPRTDRAKHGQQREQRHRASVAEAQPGDAAVTDGDGVGDLLQGPGGGDRVMAEPLSGEQSPVGLEADLPQCGQVP
jgi:hypothetical protein